MYIGTCNVHLICKGSYVYGPRTETPTIPLISELGHPNSIFVPATDRIIPLPHAGNGKHKVGVVVCEAFWQDGSLHDVGSRTVARKQMERLDELGFKLYSGFESEFYVVDAKTKEPLLDGVDFSVDQILAANSEWVFDLEQGLYKCGIDVGAMHTEYGPGQFELCMAPEWNMKTADDMYVFKGACKEILAKHGRQATFMTKPFARDHIGCSGFHFNHSLWRKSDNKSAFYDDTKPNNMSDVMRHWVGGLMKHIVSLLAICSPTPNCYRRIYNAWAPERADWGIDNRMTSVRVKAYDEKSCLVENRLPSSACNAYLVMAATIAAGLDGVENKIEPPAPGQNAENPKLPGDLGSCLDALEKNEVLRERLGERFVDWFVLCKRQNELSKFAVLTRQGDKMREEMERERAEYFDYI